MARKRSPDRDKAFELYREHSGKIELVEIAKQLNLPPGTIRGWKNKDKWDDQLNGTIRKNTERSKSKETFQEKLREQDIKDDGLTEKQRLFCLYYIKSFNGTTSAIKAGYASDSAHVTASQLLRNPKVSAEIKRLKGQLQEDVYVDAMDVLNRYIKIAFADMNDFIEFGQEEVPVMGMFGPMEIEDPVTGKKKPLTQMVNVLKFKDSSTIDGGLICQIRQGKDGASIKLEDRQKALDKLALYFDLFPDKFQRRVEEEKLKLEQAKFDIEKKKADDPDVETPDDGFMEALSGKSSEVWDVDEEKDVT